MTQCSQNATYKEQLSFAGFKFMISAWLLPDADKAGHLFKLGMKASIVYSSQSVSQQDLHLGKIVEDSKQFCHFCKVDWREYRVLHQLFRLFPLLSFAKLETKQSKRWIMLLE